MEKFVYATNTSSTASGPPSPTGEGFCKSCFWAIDGCAFCDRYDLGRPMVAPTNEIETFAFVYRPNKDLDLTLHNKKETRGGLPSACLHLAF